jgi:SMC interacting uncharacterized protein involved in chromosome segregation
VNWQVQALVETLGALRGHLAHVHEKHDQERAELNQRLEAAKDALSKYELSEQAQKEQLRQKTLEIERLSRELAAALQDRGARERTRKEDVK